MAHQTFKLISTYDLVADSNQTDRMFRIEVLQAVEVSSLYRCRIWGYRHYAVELALPKPPLMSHDLLPYEVTSMVNDLELISGLTASSEAEVLARAKAEIAMLCEALGD
jgi:hypothetical protein